MNKPAKAVGHDQELPRLPASAFEQLDPTELFILAEQAARIGQQKADFSEAAAMLVRVATTLDIRIRRFRAQPFIDWLKSNPKVLAKNPGILLALEKSIRRGGDGNG